MEITFFSTRNYDRRSFQEANADHNFRLNFHEASLNERTAPLASQSEAVCLFVNDSADAAALAALAGQGVRVVALRSAGYNHVDLAAAEEHGLTVVRVPAYSPYAVAEHTLALALTLNRKTHRAYNRVKDGNFSLDGLMGYDMHGQTIGIVGLGKIGRETARLFAAFGGPLLGYDTQTNEEAEALGVQFVDLDTLLAESDLITLHCPLTPETHHLINDETLRRTKKGFMLINTSRGALVDTQAVIRALKSGQVGYLALDVYEEEGDLFFEDLSNEIIQDDVFTRLLTFPNVLITGHQAFFTRDAMRNIAQVTLQNIADFAAKRPLANQIKPC